jgi:hypothetical protein
MYFWVSILKQMNGRLLKLTHKVTEVVLLDTAMILQLTLALCKNLQDLNHNNK